MVRLRLGTASLLGTALLGMALVPPPLALTDRTCEKTLLLRDTKAGGEQIELGRIGTARSRLDMFHA